jgi:Putative zincin peptidase
MQSDEPTTTSPGQTFTLPRSARLVSRLLSRATRRRREELVALGRLRQVDRVEVLAEEHLQALARRSLYLLLAGGAAFLALDLAARAGRHMGPPLGNGPAALRVLALIGANLAAYAAILPLHEALHGAAILALGGRPRFGLKLPLAAYCTAPGQLFTRNGYLAVALAPLVVLSAAGAVATWLAPDLGACLIFGLAGNISGAVGDLTAIARLLHLPPSVLIADTATGYAAYLPQE